MAAPAGQEVLAELIAQGRRAGRQLQDRHAREWGFNDAWFEENAPRLIRCSITGYGSSGPKAALPGYDFILQAESGLMSICGEPDGGPTKYGVAIVDVCTGMLACNSILAALNARHRTGKGQQVEVSLYETVARDAGQRRVERSRVRARAAAGSATAIRASCPTRPIQAADAMMALAVGNDEQFARTAEVLGHPEWADDPRFKQNRARVENREVDRRPDRASAQAGQGRRLAREAQEQPACRAARSIRSPPRSTTRTRSRATWSRRSSTRPSAR